MSTLTRYPDITESKLDPFGTLSKLYEALDSPSQSVGDL